MTLHFAYGTNMSQALMNARCPTAQALGPAALHGFRFFITRDGYASVARAAGATVHGVLWRLKPRDLAALNAYESLGTGLYRRRTLPVRWGNTRAPALVYIGRSRTRGRPRPGQIAIIAAAAREWQLPGSYVRAIEQWSVSRRGGGREADIGDIA